APGVAGASAVARRARGGLRVLGRGAATVGQTCVVTLEPLENEIEEAIDLVLMPADALPLVSGAEVEMPPDAPEALIGGAVDLGEIATEFLILGLDPYPRKPNAAFRSPTVGEDSAHPFAALASLKKRQAGEER